jgi:hypothetical protein
MGTGYNIRFLLENGADPLIKNARGLSALDFLRTWPEGLKYAYDAIIKLDADEEQQVWQEYENIIGDYYLSGNIADQV